MKTTKRLLSLILALAMLLTMASFPAFAADYTYTPKEIELKPLQWATTYLNSTEPRVFTRITDPNIFVNDKIVLPEGGLVLKAKVSNINMLTSPTGASVAPTGLVFDFFQNAANLNAADYTAADGVNRFYFAYDATAGTYGTITGIYPTMADMVAKTNKLDGIPLTSAGVWAVGLRCAVYHTSAEDAKTVLYIKDDNQKSEITYYSENNAAPYSFSFEVRETPTSDEWIVTAPAVSTDITSASIAESEFVFDPTSEDFDNTKNNLFYARSFHWDSNSNIIDSKRHITHKATLSNGKSNYLIGAYNGYGLEFVNPAYIENVKIQIASQKIVYDVYGSMDGVNWYVISQGTKDQLAYTEYQKNTHTFNVNAIVKYLRIGLVEHENNWGISPNGAFKGVTGKLNVYQGNTVTVTNGTDVTKTLTTGADGKVDFTEVFASYPAGEFDGGYIYYIDGVDVTNELADYMFTGATIVTVEKYVAPAGPVVTFNYNGTETKVEATADGVYEVPAEFKGNFSFYADADFTTLFDTTAKLTADTTIYVKEIQWKHTAKTVEFKIKDTPGTVSFTAKENGPIVAPRETIYVGDTMLIPLSSYKNLTEGLDGFVEVTSLKVTVCRYSTDSSDEWGSTSTRPVGGDITYKFSKAGVYGLRVDEIYGLDADGNALTVVIEDTEWHSLISTINGVFEVKEAPTTAPESAIAPTYTGAEGEVVALLDSDFTTSVTYRKAFGRTTAYAKCGAYSERPLNAEMNYWGSNSDNTQTFPVSQTLYIQFNLPSVSYVDNITFTTNKTYPFYDVDIYGSIDNGESWYLLNSVISTDNVYAVNGYAEIIRIVPRQTIGSGKITAYAVNGYAVSESELATSSKTTWLKDGEKVEIASLKELPVAYPSGSKNYAITGWNVDTGAGLSNASLALLAERNFKQLGTLVPTVKEIPFAASALTGTLAPAGQDVKDGKTFSGKYINGFYVEGTQIRIPEGDGATAIKGGLRFVNILDNALIAELDAQRTAKKVLSYEYGTLAMASTKYTGGDLVIGYNQYTEQVPGERIFASAEDFENKYFKYTVCVTGIDPKYYATDVMVRPYITINMTDGTSVTLYGEQYQTSIYDASVAALKRNEQLNDLTEEEEIHIQAIVDEVEK